MNKYTIYCTEEQTKKVIELGVPLAIYSEEYDNSKKDNEFYITNDIIFMNNENICRNEEFDLVCIIGEKPNRKAYFVPTAEQMIGWLEEKGIAIDIHTYFSVGNGRIHHYQFTVTDSTRVFNGEHSSRKEAILAGIDAALNYLIETGSNMENKTVSFKVAMALKDAEYPQDISSNCYSVDTGERYYTSCQDCWLPRGKYVNAPTYIEVWLWLWANKKAYIQVEKKRCVLSFEWGDSCTFKLNSSPEEAIIIAIEYLVDNDLIK